MKRYIQFILIVLAAGAIYPLIYLRTNYQETILTVFKIGLDDLNIIYTVLGFIFILGYFPSGILSDKFSAKYLLVFSLLGTAFGGFWFAQIPDYASIIGIFCLWGVFSVFTFWGAHMKLVKLLSTPEEEGRFFGFLDGGRGIIEAVLASVALLIFSHILEKGETLENKTQALQYVIYMYSAVLLAAGILIALFVEKEGVKSNKNELTIVESTQEEEQGFDFKDVNSVVKNKFVYLMGAIIFCSYAVTWVVYYYGGFMEKNLKITPVMVNMIMVIVLWMRPIGGILGGFLADKFGKSLVLVLALLGAAFTLFGIAFLPAATTNFNIYYILIVLGGTFVYAVRGTYWSLLGDSRIDNKIMGTAVGFISLLGYLPDILIPYFSTIVFNKFGPEGGYNAYFIISAIFGIAAICFVTIFKQQTQKNN
ncbi:MFS transporter [Flavobacterium sp. MC2016-06]|jgi:MFS family permease|uniref:MFS transporter n=1 Tax=Flavobacterium sp. MC2016-06 TaxID=2676308 RepID=UPI0012BB1570|nr:MFS transporter [Flavobacterium sp. MC2016-06]MBU3861764.1 MFS transporter [Flavobacterium sp. MC2016-06]